MYKGRIRRVHPDFWSDKRVHALSDSEALGFLALWCRIVDDHGRAVLDTEEYRMMVPRFPPSTWEKHIYRLAEAGLIMVYESGDDRYVFIPKFTNIQKVNRPSPSLCPMPPEEGDGIIPPKEKPKPVDAIPYQDIVSLWNEICGVYCPSVNYQMLGSRRAMIRRVWESGKRHRNLEWWRDFFIKISKSDFLTGRKGGPTNWHAPFQWTLAPGNMMKILEGNYDNKEVKGKAMKRQNQEALKDFIDQGKEDDENVA